MSFITSLLHNHAWSHLKHRRGEGIHSPFAYKVVSEGFSRRRMISYDRELYDALRKEGIRNKFAVRMQNLYTCMGYAEFLIDGRDRLAEPRVIYVMTPETDADTASKIIDEIRKCDSVVCLTEPRKSGERYRFCAGMVERHGGMSMDITGCVLLFYREGLSKQHLKL